MDIMSSGKMALGHMALGDVVSKNTMKWVSRLLVGSILICASCRRSTDNVESEGAVETSSTPVSRGPLEGDWISATEPRLWSFPRDHAAHTDHWIEWWYYTGNVESKSGRRFGFHLTFFRTGVDRKPTSASAWAVRDLYIAHFAISDVYRKKITSFEKTNRGGVGWAGADETVADETAKDSKIRIWNAGWETTIDDSGDRHRLKANAENASIDLTLIATKPLVQQHGDGLSQKGPTPGNASHYYSFTSLSTKGTLRIDGEEFQVEGQSWMDHEFSSSFLEKGQVGWDWMALQLDDDTQLMLYQIRQEDGIASPYSSGTIDHADGRREYLTASDIRMKPKRYWTSKKTTGKYPIAWNVKIPKANLDLNVNAAFDDQEMDTTASTGIIYWEGCVDITGKRKKASVKGKGYLEMTGYAKP